MIAAIVLAAPGCRCEHQHSDGGLPDSGPPDAGPPDAGPPDAGPPDAGPPDAGPPDGGTNFCDQYVRAFCDWYQGCGQLDPAQYEDCVALQAWICLQAQIDAVVDAGKLGFDTAAVPGCLTAIRASSCDRAYPAPSQCDALFTPATPVGGSCTRQWSTLCSDGYCHGDTCPAQCDAWLAADAGCTGTEGDECGPYGYCAFGTPRTCVPFVPSGAPCTANDRCVGGVCDTAQQLCLGAGSQPADAGCASDTVCGAGLYCKQGSCQPSETDGGPCRLYGGADCAAGYACRITDGGSAGTCGPRSGPDGGCYGLPNECAAGLFCDSPALFAPGTCLSAASVGEPCVHALQNCKVGLLCDPASQLCRTLPKVGEPCVRDPGNFRSSDCVGGFCPADAGSDGGTRCVAPQPGGAPCTVPWECASTQCTAGVCEALCTSF